MPALLAGGAFCAVVAFEVPVVAGAAAPAFVLIFFFLCCVGVSLALIASLLRPLRQDRDATGKQQQRAEQGDPLFSF